MRYESNVLRFPRLVYQCARYTAYFLLLEIVCQQLSHFLPGALLYEFKQLYLSLGIYFETINMNQKRALNPAINLESSNVVAVQILGTQPLGMKQNFVTAWRCFQVSVHSVNT